MNAATEPPRKEWRGRYYEDFAVGDAFRSRIGCTITDTDNIWFTALTMNTNQVHFNEAFAERSRQFANRSEQLLHRRAGHGPERAGHE